MSAPQTHAAFRHLKDTSIVSLNITVEEYEHAPTGARHYHIRAEDPQNAFLVAFRTVPQDSTGVAHILEHTALCGSEKYPVRDPFFMMTRRSLNTFMNAFTASDWTAYPFASKNRKDYFNLLDVYLDAAFFASLDEMDFRQEGHRVEFAEADNPDSDLVFKGVVYNEMKGAMSSPVSTLWQTLTEHLYPTTTYHYNSGGDPAAIPDLGYEDLVAFYKRHYHPSNAVFMTYGDIPAAEIQARVHDQALAGFEHLQVDTAVPDEQRYAHPKRVDSAYALDEEDTRNKTHIVVSWLLGHNTDLLGVLRAHLLTGVLMENSASPLLKALETTGLGSAPSPLCGLEDSNREMVFAAGLEGSEPEHTEAVERLILSTLEEVAEKGVDPAMVEAVLHQLELSQREITGDSFPYGLQLILHALPTAIHEGDAPAILNLEPVLAQLREEIKDPDYIPRMVRELLLDNSHRVTLTLRPDTTLSQRQAEAEKARLAAIKAGLSEAEKEAVIERAKALEARQNRKDDPELLPKVGLEDVPAELDIPQGHETALAGRPSTWFDRSTNGISYQQVVMQLPDMPAELLELLPIFSNVVTEVGSAGRDYLATQARISEVTGGISAFTSLRGNIDDVQRTSAYFTVGGKALGRNQAALAELLQQTLESARFDELPRLRELVAQQRFMREQGIIGNGHAHAMSCASSGMSPTARMAHQWRGLQGTQRLKRLDEALDTEAGLEALAANLERIQQLLLQAPRQFLVVDEGQRHAEIETALQSLWQGHAGGEAPALALAPVREPVQQAWLTSTQVNFCAMSLPAVPFNHEDAAALTVLGGFLRNGYLHRTIREQGGAYGGGAGYDPDAAAFRFFSYRDPRLEETLEDFRGSLRWLMDEPHEWRGVEEAILGVVSGIDKPGSPAGEARQAFHNRLHGRTDEARRAFRQRVLAVRLEDMRRAAEKWLLDADPSLGVVTSAANQGRMETLGLALHRL